MRSCGKLVEGLEWGWLSRCFVGWDSRMAAQFTGMSAWEDVVAGSITAAVEKGP